MPDWKIYKRFSHQALDYRESSIRLIQILPDLSTDGYIQCRILHLTINAEYACLSYRWGAELPT